MATIEIPNVRQESTVLMPTTLKDNGVAVDWSGLQNIKAYMYSDAQRVIAGKCDVEVDGEDATILKVTYAATRPQYLGVNSLLVRCKYHGREKSYDVPVLNFVERTAQATGVTVLDDPVIDVKLEVDEVSTSLLDGAIAAALDAAVKAEEAASLVPLQVLEDCVEATENAETATAAAQEAAEAANAAGITSVQASVADNEPGTPSVDATLLNKVLSLVFHHLKGAKGDTGATPNITVGTVSTGAPGTPVVITMTGTAAAPVLNITIPQGLKGDKGDQGNTGSSVEYPYELVNNLTTDDATKGLSAAQGVILDGKISQLRQKTDKLEFNTQLDNLEEITLDDSTAENGYYSSSGTTVVKNTSTQYKSIALKGINARFIKWPAPQSNAGTSEIIVVGTDGVPFKNNNYRAYHLMPLPSINSPYDIYLNFFGTGFIEEYTIIAADGELDRIANYIHGDILFKNNGYLNASTGEFVLSANWKTTDYLAVFPGDKVRVISNSYNSALAAFYDKDKVFVSAITTSNNAVTENEVTVPEGCCFMRCSSSSNTLVESWIDFIDSNVYEKLVKALNPDTPTPVIGDDSIKANNIDPFYPLEPESAELTQVLTNEYYSESTSGYTISKSQHTGLGSMEISGVEVGKKYFLKIGQAIDAGSMRNYFIFAKSTTEAVITAAEIPNYVELFDNDEHIYIITIPAGCTRVYTAGYVNTFSTFWVKDFGMKALRWLQIGPDQIPNVIYEKFDVINKKIRLFDSIEKPIVFNGKSLVAFGDSITSGTSSPNLTPAGDNKYISLFCSHAGATLVSYAKSGACITDGMNEVESIRTTITSFTGDADIIWIAGGINDWQTEAAIGTFADGGTTTLYGALNSICSYLRTNYPNAVVIFVTPIPTTSLTVFGGTHPDNLDEYRKAIQEVAAANGYNVVDGSSLGLPDTMSAFGNVMFDPSDRLHPTLAGHAMYARSLAGKLL